MTLTDAQSTKNSQYKILTVELEYKVQRRVEIITPEDLTDEEAAEVAKVEDVKLDGTRLEHILHLRRVLADSECAVKSVKRENF